MLKAWLHRLRCACIHRACLRTVVEIAAATGRFVTKGMPSGNCTARCMGTCRVLYECDTKRLGRAGGQAKKPISSHSAMSLRKQRKKCHLLGKW